MTTPYCLQKYKHSYAVLLGNTPVKSSLLKLTYFYLQFCFYSCLCILFRLAISAPAFWENSLFCKFKNDRKCCVVIIMSRKCYVAIR